MRYEGWLGNCYLLPSCQVAFTAHSPRFFVFSNSLPRHCSCHFFDSDSPPHDSHTAHTRPSHQALPFPLKPWSTRSQLRHNLPSVDSEGFRIVWFRYTRIYFVPLFWHSYFTYFSILLSLVFGLHVYTRSSCVSLRVRFPSVHLSP